MPYENLDARTRTVLILLDNVFSPVGEDYFNHQDKYKSRDYMFVRLMDAQGCLEIRIRNLFIGYQHRGYSDIESLRQVAQDVGLKPYDVAPALGLMDVYIRHMISSAH